jgi:Na+/serine symporter
MNSSLGRTIIVMILWLAIVIIVSFIFEMFSEEGGQYFRIIIYSAPIVFSFIYLVDKKIEKSGVHTKNPSIILVIDLKLMLLISFVFSPLLVFIGYYSYILIS